MVIGKNEGEQQGYSAMMWIPIQEKEEKKREGLLHFNLKRMLMLYNN